MTTAKTAPVVLRFPVAWCWLFACGGLLLGVGAGFGLPPLGRWAVDALGSVPGPVRVAMTVPPAWLVPVTTVLGLLAGLALFEIARKESLTLTVADDHVDLEQNGRAKYVSRTDIAEIYREDADLVLTGRNRRRVARFDASDLPRLRIERALREHGYPWRDDNDPYRAEFTRWADGAPGTGPDIDALLRARRRALAGKDPLAAEELDEKLSALGIDVRDRDGAQHIRHAEPPR
ncbi:hypothetical protein [Nocardia sp. NPDC127526]|uniref:YqeB family protein n=1 Tax=Nocardia sp. NPDC127526 TaxID=3345393 RepID=UPI0036336F80